MSLPERVKLVEVSPRDGLQNEADFVDTAIKVELINRLANAGFSNIESASFVSPKWVPQMADGNAVMQGISRLPNTIYSALTPNLRGYDDAIASGVNEVVIFAAASEAFSQRNINCSIAESMSRFESVAKAAQRDGLRLRGSISCALGCPYQGQVPESAVLDVVKRMQDLGVVEFDIADTIGVGTAGQVASLMSAVARVVPIAQVAGHFHDTYGQALANIYASLQVGVTIYHASVAGLGGCPYAKGATGNVATEDVLYLLNGLGIHTGVDFNAVVETGQWVSQQLGKKSVSRAGNAIAAKAST
ncbi:hydroxymethylglutaryl-CoA lyase [Paenalcaligenes niemegkensis]|uniref:hydroxymethylglutaryl-CoA lyase n=1 Tax=Paenalcaligenes niemegkensis TaxID=2895469 RepID=UPI001EE8AC83|nr:hydroxymethylglutaryl-CoA lyase [Paenalcaligenes niemegkensis]MCQ9617628.1 hydroxymethylglutaryl-CoA lyase [Paenalcaligenes niemegkensis]